MTASVYPNCTARNRRGAQERNAENRDIIVGAAKQPKEYRMSRVRRIALSIGLATGLNLAMAQAPPPAQPPPPAAAAAAARPARPAPPTRDPNTPGYVTAKELPDGANAPVTADGNFI